MCPVFMNGDGKGGNGFRIPGKKGEECINACKEHKKTTPTINGVTIRINGQNGCWCKKKMTHTVGSNLYKTCSLEG